MIKNDFDQRYGKQILLPEIGIQGQQRFSQAKVLCVGAGGLGAPLLYYLAAAGVGNLGIMDNDIIYVDNLHRQILYQTAHVGEKKVKIAAAQLHALNPHIKIDVFDENLTYQNAEAIFKNYDIIADCSDNFATRYCINDMSFASNKPFVSASIFKFQGQCGFFSGKTGPCYRCLFPDYSNENTLNNCQQAGVLGVTSGLLGVIQATEILKWFLDEDTLLNKGMLLANLLTMEFKILATRQDPHCWICVKHDFTFYQDQHAEAISPFELNFLINQKEKIFLLDVRNPEEHHNVNIGGYLIPLTELSLRLHELDQKIPIIIYCQSGIRSKSAAYLLREAQFKKIRYLAGGLDAFTKAIVLKT